MWAGIAGQVINNATQYELAISIHDSVYNTDFASSTIPFNAVDPEGSAKAIEKHVLDTFRTFSSEHLCKFLGAGVTQSLLKDVCITFHEISFVD
jgi:alpha,alpha-trehalose phosphorylase (configuration-retaining)